MANTVLRNVEGAYSTNADGTVTRLTYAEITSGTHKGTALANAIDTKAVTYTMELHKAFTDMHRSTLAIGYNFNEIMQGDTLRKMGYANVSDFSESVFDYAGSTALMYANIARQFVTYDPESEFQYHSVFAVFEENEDTGVTEMYDFSMAQLQEMLIPKELKLDSVEIWKRLFSDRLINTSSKSKRIRTIRQCIATLSKNSKELTTDNIKSLLQKSLRLEMTPEKAFTVVETTAIGTADTAPQGTPQDAPQGTPQDTERTLKERCFDSIQTFIENGTLSENIHKSVSTLSMYMQFAQENESEIVKTALHAELKDLVETFTKLFTETTETETTETETTETETTETETTETETTETETTETETTETKKHRKTGKKS